jgi:hypothetical protein
MLGLPRTSELHRRLSKKAIYEKFKMKAPAREKIDADIARIDIVNEVSPSRVNIAEGELVKAFFVVQVTLKKKNFDERTIATLSKLIPQNMIFVLEFGEESKLAVYHTKLMQTPWQPKGSFSLPLKGLSLDAVWENVIVQVGGVKIESGNTLDEQIEIDGRRRTLEREIERLDKLAWREKQPKKKFELAQEVNRLKKELEGMK